MSSHLSVRDPHPIATQAADGASRRVHILGAIGLLAIAAAATPSRAQTYAPAPTPDMTAPAVRVAAPPAPRFYGGLEYLYWSVKDAPLSAPLISTGPVSNKEGFLINSSSTILYGAPLSPAVGGNDSQSFHGLNGSRLTLGTWLNDSQTIAVEGSAFAFASQSAGYQARSNTQGSPGIRIPVYNSVPYKPGGQCDQANPSVCLIPQTEDGFPVAVPNQIFGIVTANNTIQLWGADLDGVMKLLAGPSWEVSGLAGFKFLSLEEGFSLTDNLFGISNTSFNGQSGLETDSFKTKNQFYGAGLGVRGRYNYGPFFAEGTAKLALGVSHETLSITGSYVDYGALFASSQGSYGIFAMPANEGRTSANNFAVVPEIQIKLGYNLTRSIKLTIGYDFLYDSNVIRPGDQISRDIPKGQTFQQDGTSPSTTSPARLFRTSDFFAHGLSAGVGFAF